MSSKRTGYEFWKSVLKSPRFVAAPMVDVSELAFRMLCRGHGAQLCFSPMLHSQQFLQDSLYRSDMFSTCPQDRPLVVQFCSNNPDDFVNAAMMVSSECDAVDLNLGCPQAIAKKGHYGAFLQDDWDVIRCMVRRAATDLPVPVTCKMRILPGDVSHSVHYAKMLEDSGCSVLSVHGRTRDQKGHATGLASWEAIRLIKENVHIPVIANGNILSFHDIKECLEYTGADAVMSAEALLQNPALFSGRNPPVWKAVHEYLQCAQKHNAPMRSIRCHLFKILYLCIHQDHSLQEMLAEAKTLDDFYAVCEVLKRLPEVHRNPSQREDKKDVDFDVSQFFGENEPEVLQFDSPQDSNDAESEKDAESDDGEEIETKHLPVWLCHSRPRVADEENKTRGCYAKYFHLSLSKGESMSKKKLRRERRHQRVLAAAKEKRKAQKTRRKQKRMEQRQQQPPHARVESKDKVKMTKKEKKQWMHDRLLQARGSSPRICIHLGFAFHMDSKELNRLSSQLRRLYGSNRQSPSPLHLYFCNFSESDDLYKICLEKNDGFASYVVEMTEESPEDMFSSEELVYLSPDSENVLMTLDRHKVYVIGGIVDGTVKKGLSLNHAKDLNLHTARLPIPEYLKKCSGNPGTTVLTVNQVFDILLHYYETEDWVQALSRNVPLRKGYGPPPLDAS